MTRDDNPTHIVAFTTLGSEADARALVRELVERRVIACGTAVPGATSVFRWNGAMTEESEVLVILKTHRSRWNELEDAVAELHPYDVPELIAMPVVAGLPGYLAWITKETERLEHGDHNG